MQNKKNKQKKNHKTFINDQKLTFLGPKWEFNSTWEENKHEHFMAQEYVPGQSASGAGNEDPSLIGPCSWLPLGDVSERAQLVMV